MGKSSGQQYAISKFSGSQNLYADFHLHGKWVLASN